ncbi:MAG: hypothetical protein HY553_12085 [Elusimicrobia bacterium]|nr:hypothetical protein [Elusimicrobiota bacterium]
MLYRMCFTPARTFDVRLVDGRVAAMTAVGMGLTMPASVPERPLGCPVAISSLPGLVGEAPAAPVCRVDGVRGAAGVIECLLVDDERVRVDEASG